MARKFTSADIEITAKDKTKAGVASAKKGTGDLTDAVKRYGVEMAAVAAVVAVAVRVVKDLTQAYFEQEKAVAGMEAALKATGTYTPGLSRNLQELASQLQKTSIYGDEATLSATAMLQSLAKLSGDGLMQAIPLVHDLAAGMGIDLVTAASLIGKTLGSTTNALSRYGIILDATAPKNEKLAALNKQINDSFGGMAKAMGETAAGSMVKLANATGDLKELGGGVIAVFLQPGVKWLTQLAEKAKESFDHFIALNDLFTERGWAEATGDIELARLAMADLNKQMEEEKKALEAGMRLRGMTRQEAQQSIVDLQNKIEGLQRTIVNLGRASGEAEGKVTAIGNIWTDIYGLADYPVWLKNLYEATEQAKLDALWVQMERAQANLVDATGEEAMQLGAVIELLREKILAMSEMNDDEQDLIDLLDEEGKKRGAMGLVPSFREISEAAAPTTGVEFGYTRAVAGEVDTEPIEGALDLLGGGFTDLLGSIGPIATLMGGPMSIALKALGIMFESMMEVLQPLIDSILAPLIGFFKLMGKIIGQTLAPMFKLLGDLMEALNPVLYIVYVVFKTVANVIQWFADVVTWVIRFLNPFKKAGKFPSLKDALSDIMSYQEFKGDIIAGGTEEEEEAGVTPSTQTVTRPPDIYNTFIFNGTFVDTSWERFVDLITAEQQRQTGLVAFGT